MFNRQNFSRDTCTLYRHSFSASWVSYVIILCCYIAVLSNGSDKIKSFFINSIFSIKKHKLKFYCDSSIRFYKNRHFQYLWLDEKIFTYIFMNLSYFCIYLFIATILKFSTIYMDSLLKITPLCEVKNDNSA